MCKNHADYEQCNGYHLSAAKCMVICHHSSGYYYIPFLSLQEVQETLAAIE